MTTITIKKEISDKELRYVGVTAVEGGIGYWSQIHGYGAFSRAFDTDEPINNLGRLYITDDETGEVDLDEPSFELTTEFIGEGLRKAIEFGNWKQINDAVSENDVGSLDAEAADVIVQLACFGDVVYG